MRTLNLSSSRDSGPFSVNGLLVAGFLAANIACAGSTGALISDACAGEALRLPEMGDPASIVLSPTQEALLGKTLLTQIRGALRVSTDPELNEYVQALGTRLTAAGLNSGLEFHFLLVADRNINAFAAPGGIVAVNTGLLLT
ncbi:MAG: hypothetical protein H0V34_12880, partial [Gammaproteobacteria bacterium]|nr:hypothetical protein [Gammaproteobacteria bacterium]